MAGPADWGAVPVQAAPVADGPAAWGAQPVEQQPGVLSDVAHAAGPALERGLMAALTAAPTMADLALRGINHAIDYGASAAGYPGYLKSIDDANNRYADYVKKSGLPSLPVPTYGNLQSKVEDATGPLYEAKTPVGKVAQTALELAPTVASGGGSLVQKAAQLGGAVGGGEAGEAVGGKFGYPNAGKLVGTLFGSALPRAITPFPQPSARYATDVANLKEAGVPLTAGRTTGSPFLQKIESGLGSKTDEGEAFTKAATKITGSGAANPQEIVPAPHGGAPVNALAAQEQQLKNGYTQFFGTRQIPYGNLSNDVDATVQKYLHTAGKDADPIVADMAQKIILGKSGQPMANAQVAGMDGDRYQFLKDTFENAISKAGGTEKKALIEMKGKMEDALKSSMNPQEAKAFDDLNRQYSNLRTVAKAKQAPGGQITPQALASAAAKRAGTEGFNLGKAGEAGDLAQAGVNVLQPRPSFETTGIPASIGAIGGGIVGGSVPFLAGHGFDPTSAIWGSMEGGAIAHLLASVAKPAVRGVYYNPMVQALLGNQVMGKGGADPSLMARLLATPQAQGTIAQQVK